MLLILVSSTYAGREGHPEDVEYIKEAAKQTPVFLINGFVEGKNIYCSFCDDFKATYDVTSGFIRRGKKKILFLCDSYSYSASKKMAGYEAALRDARISDSRRIKVLYKEQDSSCQGYASFT